jgi:ribosome-associated protein
VTTGILGGTFDPPHNGHVALARAALERLPIDRLVVLVAERPGHRGTIADAADRLRLAEAAFADLPAEVVLDPNAFTVDAVRDGRFGDALFVVGADEGAAFPVWREPDEVLRRVRLAVGTRSGYPTWPRTATASSPSSSTLPRSPRPRCASGSPQASLSTPWCPKPSRARSRSSTSTAATLIRHPKGHDEPLTPLDHARRIAGLAQDKLAQDVLILDMRPVCSYTDFFVLATGQNQRQTKAIWDEVRERLKHEEGVLPRSIAGESEGRWIVGDYLDVVFHVFTPESREYYRLEELWGDVPSIELDAAVV